MSISGFFITLDKKEYFPGDTMKGAISLAADSSVDLKNGVQVLILGIAQYSNEIGNLNQYGHQLPVSTMLHDEFLKHEINIPVFGRGVNQDYPFEYKLPSSGLPRTFDCWPDEHCHVEVYYDIEAVIITPLLEDGLKTSMNFRVRTIVNMISHPNETLAAHLKIRYHDNVHCWGCYRSLGKPLLIDGTVEPPGIYPGEKLTYSFTAKNDSLQDVQYFRVAFVQVWKIFYGRDSKTEKDYCDFITEAQTDEGVLKGGTVSCQGSLSIPLDVLPTDKFCAIKRVFECRIFPVGPIETDGWGHLLVDDENDRVGLSFPIFVATCPYTSAVLDH